MTDTYQAVHKRLRRRRGNAREHECTAPDCDRMASRWSWQRTGPSASGAWNGKPVTWGLDIDTYRPMCASHATMLDRGGSLTHCPRGHVRAEWGRDAGGTCIGCRERRPS